MRLKSKLMLAGAATMAALFLGVNADAAVGDQGVDWSKYQGTTGVFGYKSDKFTLAQLGGTYGGTLITQQTYASQVKSARANGLRAHTYIWYGVGSSITNAKAGLDYYLPKVQTPKGSIVALDYEDGATSDKQANTDAVLYGMRRVKAAGYTPMYYSYKPYTLKHVDYKRILAEFPNSLWMAAYPDYLVTSKPNYSVFPTMDGVALYQFTSTYRAGGLDGNVDLTGITDNGYTKQTPSNSATKPASKPNSSHSAKWVKESKTYDLKTAIRLRAGASTSSKAITILPTGATVKTDRAIIKGGYRWVRQPRATGYAYLATGPKSNTLEYVKAHVAHAYYKVKSGDSWWAIAQRNGLSMTTLASQNGKTIYTTIYPGQRLVVR